MSCWLLLQVRYGWKRGSPQPGAMPNGYLTVMLPQVFGQVWLDAGDGRTAAMRMRRRAAEEEFRSFISGG